MGRRTFGRPLDGILVLDKSPGMTSNAALQRARRLLFARKAGHTGNLDPLASGVLPICFGEATKFSQLLLDADKTYRATVRLGVTTETGDADGAVVASADPGAITREEIEAALEPLRGDIEQTPPMYSALKHKGRPLYEYARRGESVEREARPVTIHSLTLLDFRAGNEAEFDIDVECSKGTYIRTLAEEIGAALGVGAHLSRLRRTRSGPFDIDQAITLDALEEERGEDRAETLDHHLLPIDAALEHLPSVQLDPASGRFFQQGQPVIVSGLYRLAEENAIVRVFRVADSGAEEQPEREFLGIGTVLDDGRVAPKRLVVGA